MMVVALIGLDEFERVNRSVVVRQSVFLSSLAVRSVLQVYPPSERYLDVDLSVCSLSSDVMM